MCVCLIYERDFKPSAVSPCSLKNPLLDVTVMLSGTEGVLDDVPGGEKEEKEDKITSL